MLFPYTYVPHRIEKMQEFITFIFFEVWCKAPNTKSYSLDLFEPLPELWEVMRDFSFADPQPAGAKFFCEHLESIYKHFSLLTPAQINQFQQWFSDNNDMERACAADPASNVVRYKDIASLYPNLYKQIASFFRGLYDQSLLSLAPLKDKIGKIEEHNKAFFEVNSVGKCPFCGLSDLKGIHHTRREAYDHYLPKFRYPFNSINFRNLAPACHECNSAYKLSKDPAHNATGRRKAFYPYSRTSIGVDVSLALNTKNIEHLEPNDVTLSFGPVGFKDEIDTWRDVYGIDERYKAKCCSNDAQDWLELVRIFRDAHGVSPAASLVTLQQQTVTAPVANSNFLRKAFLEGCQSAGLFDVFAEAGNPL